ncbi:hypothetical protein A9R05_17685 [Burkholderia sp. KK1]|nr:hypothetical protein A9R05_17685 [Burkholderia sp. KK1]
MHVTDAFLMTTRTKLESLAKRARETGDPAPVIAIRCFFASFFDGWPPRAQVSSRHETIFSIYTSATHTRMRAAA